MGKTVPGRAAAPGPFPFSPIADYGAATTSFRFVKRNSIGSGQIRDPEPDFIVVVLNNGQQETVQIPDHCEVTFGGNFLAD